MLLVTYQAHRSTTQTPKALPVDCLEDDERWRPANAVKPSDRWVALSRILCGDAQTTVARFAVVIHLFARGHSLTPSADEWGRQLPNFSLTLPPLAGRVKRPFGPRLRHLFRVLARHSKLFSGDLLPSPYNP